MKDKKDEDRRRTEEKEKVKGRIEKRGKKTRWGEKS